MRRFGPVNPVLQRELTERWRSRRAVIALTVYLTLLGLVLYLLYRTGLSVLTAEASWSGGQASGPALGRFLFESLLLLVLVLVLFVAPGYAAAQLSGERERRTLPLLQATLLRPRHIVAGKLGASVAWILLLIVAALPLGAAAFFLGGVAVGELLRGVGFIAGVGVGVAAIALGISSLVRRTTTSIVLTYAAVLALGLGTLFAAGVEAVLGRATPGPPPTPVALHLNPFVGLADAAAPARVQSFGALPAPLSGIASVLPRRRDPAVVDRGVMVEEPMVAAPEPMPPPVPEEPPPAPDGLPPGPPPQLPDAMPPPQEQMPPMPQPMPPPEAFDRPGPVPMPGPEPQPVEPVSDSHLWLWVLGTHGALGLGGLVVATRRLRSETTAARALRGRGRRARAEAA